jgi:diguanylate cyclase (GGDEF)-like protein/PAS domain S-box-containing protein
MDVEFYRELLNALGDGVCFVDRQRRVSVWNKAATRLSGYAAEEVLGQLSSDTLRHLDVDGQDTGQDDLLLATLTDGKVREAEVYMHHKYGYSFPVTVRTSPVRDRSGAVIGAVEVFSNNQKRINVLKELENLQKEALSDPLTGIGNRRFAEITLKPLEASFREHGVPFGVLFVDIDHFKDVNDRFGHVVGDLVLRMVAQTLANSLRPLDVACRWGGEEFVLLMPIVTEDALRGMGERQRALIQRSWLDNGGEPIFVTASFGGAVCREGESGGEVIARADAQMYRSKASGRNCVFIDAVAQFQPMTQRSR